MVHGNLSPRTIFVTPAGQWKLGGFGFLQKQRTAVGMRMQCNRLEGVYPQEVVPRYPPPPSLYHCAPELLQAPHVYNEKADIWSFGALAFEVYSQGSFVAGGGSEARDRRRLSDWHTAVVHAAQDAHTRGLDKVPQLLRHVVGRALQVMPTQRPGAREVLECAFFKQEGPLRTVIRVEGLLELADLRLQTQELTSLQTPIQELPLRLQREMVLPKIAQLSRAPELAPYCLPLLVSIARAIPREDFAILMSANLGALLRPPSGGRPVPPQLGLQIARHLSALASVGDGTFVESHVLGALGFLLESSTPQVVIAALKELVPTVNALRVHLPVRRVESVIVSGLGRVQKRVAGPPSAQGAGAAAAAHSSQQEQQQLLTSVRVHALVAVTGLLRQDAISHEMLSGSVFPLVQTCVKADRSAGVLMAAVGVLESCTKTAQTSQLGRNILPMVSSLSCEPTLSLDQFMKVSQVAKLLLEDLTRRRREELGFSRKSKVATTDSFDGEDAIAAATAVGESFTLSLPHADTSFPSPAARSSFFVASDPSEPPATSSVSSVPLAPLAPPQRQQQLQQITAASEGPTTFKPQGMSTPLVPQQQHNNQEQFQQQQGNNALGTLKPFAMAYNAPGVQAASVPLEPQQASPFAMPMKPQGRPPADSAADPFDFLS
ncbi:SCY1-like protein 2 [Hondaea fermentalgiana]|uniref:SCY1-like protein 2 n=1 Tax=Hondaea fermentalgiana TaxID=2315210 RepID=A0A2R5GDH9_9STRA|nr:SCY1-like protein 2 [Hondaea fermentalgiana]|eukprot:GBG26241.1 SCY1-like protein 2 [Hondaea fermentalgiana]